MRKARDDIDNRSKAELLATIAQLKQQLASLQNNADDCLLCRVKLIIPLNGDVYSIRHHYSNQLLLDSLQYTHQQLDDYGDDYFNRVVCENDHFVVRKMIGYLSCNVFCDAYRLLFRMVCKNKDALWILWSCRVTDWYYRGKPKMILCCGILIDKNTHDMQQFQPCLNMNHHWAKIELARKLDEALRDVLVMMYQQKSNAEIADRQHLSIPGLKSRKKRLLIKLELACMKDLKNFIFESSLFY